MSHWLAKFLADERLPDDYGALVERVARPMVDDLAARVPAGGLVLGVCGAQGSGKSTLTAVLARLLELRGLRVASLSLDDLYLTHDERVALGARVHPLLATRGVPGTHDVALGRRLLEDLRRPGRHVLPTFDKAADDRGAGRVFEGAADVVLFEGWCVGARPQPPGDLTEPINSLERERDPDGAWRAYVNTALAGDYQALFGGIGRLVLLQAPSFEAVLGWRLEQERKLRDRLVREGRGAGRAMSDAQVTAFIQHYERLTRWILAEMPGRADAVVRLDEHRRPIG